MQTQGEGDFRSTPEYIQAKPLLIEKAQLQARLRNVDKLLRGLDLIRPGIAALARQDIERLATPPASSIDILWIDSRIPVDSPAQR